MKLTLLGAVCPIQDNPDWIWVYDMTNKDTVIARQATACEYRKTYLEGTQTFGGKNETGV